MMRWGSPLRCMSSFRKSSTLSAFGQVSDLTWVHLVNLSIATKTLLNLPSTVGRGPIMSSAQQAKGQVGGILTSL
jgi:hypothetical protein